MDFLEAFLCASMKNMPVNPSIWMVHLKWIEILEWTTTMFEQSLSAWQFHNFPSDLARKGWCLLLIGEDNHATINEVLSKMSHQHCCASINILIHHESTIHRLLFSLFCHLQTILSFPSTNYSSSSTIWSFPLANYCFLLAFGVWKPSSIFPPLSIFPPFDIWSLTTSSIFPPLSAERWEYKGFHVVYP